MSTLLTQKLYVGTQTTIIAGAALNGLANNALVLGSAFDNTIAAAGDGGCLCDLELYLDSLASAATANTAFALWLLQASDGTNYEDGGTSVTPARMPDVVFPLRAVSTVQRVVRKVWLPWGVWIPLLKNDGSGQGVGANNNSFLKVRPVTFQLIG